MAEKTYRLDIVTPEKKIFSDMVEFSVFPGSEGEMGILINHAPLVSRLKAGEIRITRNHVVEAFTITGGFLEVMNNEVTVLADAAEPRAAAR
jgi:F-type H+-transporting ATPase subunit epsilon